MKIAYTILKSTEKKPHNKDRRKIILLWNGWQEFVGLTAK